jgi:hypothetical protein
MTLTVGQPLWARFFSQQTQGYVVKPLGKVQRVEPERVMVNGKWHPTSALGHGLYTSVEQGEADIRARPFRVPRAPGT